MSSAGTVTGKGFVISYSVQSGNSSGVARGGYTVTIDSSNVATCAQTTNGNGGLTNITANGSHLFFTEKIALAFTTSRYAQSSYYATGSGSMKYILGS